MQDIPQHHYQHRRDHFTLALGRATRRADHISDLRLAVFAGAVAMAAAAWMGYLSWWWLLPPLFVFVALVIWHEQVYKAKAHAALGVDLYSTWLEASQGRPRATPFEGLSPIPSGHRYARDLDLFGRGGLFELLCRTRTAIGAGQLAEWMLEPAPRDIVLARQQAVQELAAHHALREALALEAGAVQAQVSQDDLRRWANEPALLDSRSKLVVASILTALAAIMAAAGIATGTLIPVIVLAVNIIFFTFLREGIKSLDASLAPISRELRTLGTVLCLLEESDFHSPLLQEKQALLGKGKERASAAVRRLERLVIGYETYQNQLFLPLALYVLWPFWWGVAIERWRALHRDALSGTWLQALGELEALCSMAGYSFERPDDAWPAIVEGTPHYVASELGHPLLPPDHRVRNDVRIDGEHRILMVSGSNMSGKSTLLRAIGINAVLAQMGAPVCAAELDMSPLKIGAVIRVEDSLQRGASRFYAEIERFKLLLDAAASPPPLLFLADEILHGTNTHDRVVGAQALIRALLQQGAIGLVTTHDLALTEFVAHLPHSRNVHFQDDIVDGRLAFDYQLRDGVVKKSNALDLMRAVGLPVE